MVKRRPSLRELEAQRERFNKQIAVGDVVVVKMDGTDELRVTRTRTPAQILGGHSTVVWLTDIVGCYFVERVVKAWWPDAKVPGE